MNAIHKYTLIRAVKIAVSVAICIVLFHFSDRGAPIVASLSAVAPLMTSDLHTTLKVGKNTIIGNIVGGGMALLYFFITELDHANFEIEIFLLPFFIVLVVLICELLHEHSGIVAAISTTILISLSVSYGESFSFALDRIIDTFIGTLVAVGINALFKPTRSEIKEMIQEDQKVLSQKQSELDALSNELKERKK